MQILKYNLGGIKNDFFERICTLKSNLEVKNIMKKTIVIVLVILFCITSFTGCCNETKASNIIDWGDFEVLPIQIDLEYIPDKIVYWNKFTGELIEEYKHISITRRDKIPICSQYRGYSIFAGYLFQNGTTVYSVFPMNSKTPVKVISRSVIEIIYCNEYLSDQSYSNPIFLMKDGSYKGYIPREKELIDYPVKREN